MKPFSGGGYLPCTLMGQSSGFEIYFENAAEFGELTVEQPLKGWDFIMAFRWGGYLEECACALWVALALATSHDALVYSPDEDRIYSGALLNSELDDVLKELAQASS